MNRRRLSAEARIGRRGWPAHIRECSTGPVPWNRISVLNARNRYSEPVLENYLKHQFLLKFLFEIREFTSMLADCMHINELYALVRRIPRFPQFSNKFNSRLIDFNKFLSLSKLLTAGGCFEHNTFLMGSSSSMYNAALPFLFVLI